MVIFNELVFMEGQMNSVLLSLVFIKYQKKISILTILSVNDSKPYGSHFPPIRMVFKKYQ